MTIIVAPADDNAGRNPNPVDVYVGVKIRARRKTLGLSQEQLADALGLTFQQVQKYERGRNRVSASKLHAAAIALQVPPAYFFEGLADYVTPNASAGPSSVDMLAATHGGPEMADTFVRLTPADQRMVADLAGRLAGQALQ